MAIRTALVVAAIGYALLAGLSGIDRYALVRAAPGKPATAWSSQGLIPATQQRLASGDYAAGLVLARRAVASNPVEPGSTALLGAAMLGTGNPEGAARAFTVAGQMGWRVPITQIYWMEQALEGGDYRVAMLRFDALLRQDPEIVTDRHLMAPFELNAAGRDALFRQLRQQPTWLDAYLTRVDDLADDQLGGRAQVVSALGAAGVKAGCGKLAGLLWRLINTGAGATARQLWTLHCPGADNGLVPDGNFRAISSDQAGPFGWQMMADADVSINPGAEQAGGRTLAIANSAPSRRQVVRQLVVGAPGRYRLSWSATDSDGKPSDRIRAALGCPNGSPGELEGRYDPARKLWTADVVLAPSCNGYWLEFSVLPGTAEVNLTSVAMSAI